eukprot:762075-Hanusia_phi.AAC.1
MGPAARPGRAGPGSAAAYTRTVRRLGRRAPAHRLSETWGPYRTAGVPDSPGLALRPGAARVPARYGPIRGQPLSHQSWHSGGKAACCPPAETTGPQRGYRAGLQRGYRPGRA